MLYKKMMLESSGIIGRKEAYLTEGIKFFKTSKTLDKIIKKMYDGAKKESKKGVISDELSPSEKSSIRQIIKKLEVQRDKFREIEDEFASEKNFDEKKLLKQEYKDLIKKNKEIMEMINKQKLFTALKVVLGVGVLALFVACIYSISYGFTDLLIHSKKGLNGVTKFPSEVNLWNTNGARGLSNGFFFSLFGAGAAGTGIGLISLIKKIRPTDAVGAEFLKQAKDQAFDKDLKKESKNKSKEEEEE